MDGHRIQQGKKKNHIKFTTVCTRWEELKDCVEHHVNMAAKRKAPTIFRFLNNPGLGNQQFSVCHSNSCDPVEIMRDVQNASSIMNKVRPQGCTPLTAHIRKIRTSISGMSSELLREGKKIAIIIATDGLPTDEQGFQTKEIRGEFIEALRSLEGLPIWLVIKLCTDEEDVVKFYNGLDDELELSLEVLDDYLGEAQQVYSCNKWLNYALPLHRIRESGFHDKLFDMLNERKLSKGELREFCELLFGQTHFDGCPDPAADWKGFLGVITSILKQEDKHYNPIKKKPTPWIDIRALNKIYGDGYDWKWKGTIILTFGVLLMAIIWSHFLSLCCLNITRVNRSMLIYVAMPW